MTDRSRTRLDEIVEEESKHPSVAYWNEHANNTFKKVAERAFRHGVERAWADRKRMIDVEVPSTDSLIYKYSHKTSVDAIQPAPAGEKEPLYWRAGVPVQTTNTRKGERRKLDNWPQNYVHDWADNGRSRPIYQSGTHGSFFYDRRSGKDRRGDK